MKKAIDRIRENYSKDIYKSTENFNETYLEVNPESIIELCRLIHTEIKGSLVSLFASDERKLSGKFSIYYVFALKENHCFLILKTLISEENPAFKSISTEIHAASLYEREIKDMFGLIPQGHPDIRPFVFHGNWPEGCYPLRKDFDGKEKPPFAKNDEPFIKVQGEGVYEIPVGPVHAGIIEPGHFRFSVAGEPIINLEAKLFYVHKGIEKLCEGMSIEKGFYLSERISGDESFTNALAYCLAIEKIAKVKVSDRVSFMRVIFAELERLVSHLGDLAGICVDVAYGFGAFQFRMLRGWTYQIIEEVTGSRFLRSVSKPGGIRRDFISGKEKNILDFMLKIENELQDTVKILKSNSLFIDRVEHTGILKNTVAKDLNAVGPPARAAGLKHDVRKDFPYLTYDQLEFKIPEHNNGDVNCRMHVKIEECLESIDLIRKALDRIPAKGELFTPINTLEPYRFALGYTEAPRGENIHWIMTGENNTLFRYKIRTPSFCNWPVLCHAVNGNIVPDFPLINKSFNLSYAGNDL
ncbi:MAG: NADH-quinone oxidoreductase subunit C [Clostridia bacterium]|nr:NADH-quinone oxidoreductase subunit C [Clostridia bacterium]